MCTSPILIRNKKFRSISVDIPNKYIKVPCGSCDECLRKRAKDLYIRVRFQVENDIKNGGVSFMCCLTYDNETVPLFHHLGKTYMVFNKKHVINFIKRLRTHLDRFFRRHYNCDAPDFKYLVTSEFGTDPDKTHRPHYHLIVTFSRPISLFVFRMCFECSLYSNSTGERYFGKIYQCELLDLKRGGIRYSSKYILKDQYYDTQNNIIKSYIDFYTHFVNCKYDINEFPVTSEDYFKNKCIRSSKQYKNDIANFVGQYRNMQQFYLCSNDLGCSAIIDRYGESLFSLGVLNIDQCPYSIPKQVIQRLERSQGSERKDIIVKTVFLSRFKDCLEDCLHRNLINHAKYEELYDFASHFLQPRFGSLYFLHPNTGLSYYFKVLCPYEKGISKVFDEFNFYDENDFYRLRNEVISVINLCNTSDILYFRAKVAKHKSDIEKENYERKKRNKGL